MSNPTHVVLCSSTRVDEREALASYHGTVLAGLDHGTTVDVHLDADHLPGVASEPLTEIADTFELVADCHYRGELPDDAGAVAELLDVESWDEAAALERIVLSADGHPYLVSLPDEAVVRVDDGVAEGVATDVADALADQPVGPLPTTSLVRWRDDGREYDLSPPGLRVDDAVFDLTDLVAVRPDRGRRQIDLRWESSNRGLLGRLVSQFGTARPTRFTFDTTGAYDRVAREFETVADALGIRSTDESSPRE